MVCVVSWQIPRNAVALIDAMGMKEHYLKINVSKIQGPNTYLIVKMHSNVHAAME